MERGGLAVELGLYSAKGTIYLGSSDWMDAELMVLSIVLDLLLTLFFC